MATFQDVRGAMAKLVSDALTAAGIPFDDQTFDNVRETPPQDAGGRYATISISFPETVIETIGCEGMDRIIASCNVVLYTPKDEGMKPAEDIAQAVIHAWVQANKAVQGVAWPRGTIRLKTWNINGPNVLAPDQRPHQVTQLSCAFNASWSPA